MKTSVVYFAVLLLLGACANPKGNTTSEEIQPRIISLSGSITETLFDLGWGEKIIGVDVTSTFPEQVQTLPILGHVRSIAPEAALAMKPTHIFVLANEVNPSTIRQWKDAGILVVEIQKDYSIEGCLDAISVIGEIISEQQKANAIKEHLSEKLKQIKDTSAPDKVLFIYARGGGNLMVSGLNTPVANMISFAGAKNAIQEFEDYKPLSTEYLVKSNPDVILMFDSGLRAIGGEAGLAEIPGISQTKAFQTHRIISMDGLLLSGFGPRTAEGIEELQLKIFQSVE